MAGFTSYNVDNDKSFKLALEAATKASDDLRIPFGLISKDFYRSQKAIFGLKGPGKYPDITPETKKQKQREVGFIYPILKRKGFLEASLTSPRGAGAINIITKKELGIGTAVPYAVFHQSDEPRKKIPLRKMLFIGPEAPRFANTDQAGRPNRWGNIMQDFIIQISKLKGVGG